eukprot:TRINITY_DN22036_c0_g1_i1.p1 TRINITY_DN22036_c0_g1~~TRINITY_DN22036_c0_g1_i1.p1  ORF type:complete len:158 (-),score=2.93 TRINITY_DN22036_c0_g1_i1:55-528(-)
MIERCERLARRAWNEQTGRYYTPQTTGNSMMSWMCEVDDDYLGQVQGDRATLTRQQFGKQKTPRLAPDYWSWCRPEPTNLYSRKYPRTLRSTLVAGQFATPRIDGDLEPLDSRRSSSSLGSFASSKSRSHRSRRREKERRRDNYGSDERLRSSSRQA